MPLVRSILALMFLVGWTVAVAQTVVLREPSPRTLILLPDLTASARLTSRHPLRAAVDARSGQRVELGHRLLLRVRRIDDLTALLTETPLPILRRPDPRSVVIACPSPLDAIQLASRWATDPRVEIASPSLRRFNATPHSDWGPAPDDVYFDRQWYLDPNLGNTSAALASSGMEFRAIWPRSTATSVIIAFYDDGVDFTHPDLREGYLPDLARNWFTRAINGSHSSRFQYHGTAVAGLAAARSGNRIGISGAAPGCRFTACVIFDASSNLPETEDLAQAFEHRTDLIPIQNHSWGNADLDFLEAYPGERIALSNAVHHGRSGLGTIMVRAAGNTRFRSYLGRRGVGDANLDAFANEPGAITVAGLRRSGSVASYSAPGACILVAAPGGESAEGSQFFTLDPVGDNGVNSIAAAGRELSDYIYGTRSSAGTSFATPLVTGVVAVMIDVRPDLHLLDLQRLLVLASHPIDPSDPDLATNRAGLLLSHNVGFGTPHPGTALRLASSFSRPHSPRSTVSIRHDSPVAIPDDGLRVVVSLPDQPDAFSFPAAGGTGLHPDEPTPPLAFVDAGVGATPLTTSLNGAAALLQRQPNEPAEKIQFAAQAGAGAVIIANSDFDNRPFLMLSTDAATLPAVSVGRTHGEQLRTLAVNQPDARLRFEIHPARIHFDVTNTLSLDWVQLRVRIQHARMGDLRITLRSPTGTRSILHRSGTQTTAQIGEWWYSTKRHLFESSHGSWTLEVSDQAGGISGSVLEAELILHGIPLNDSDFDGLDDDWEEAHFGSLAADPGEDPDDDGWTNAAEAFVGTDPQVSDRPLLAHIHAHPGDPIRIAWPVQPGRIYQLERAPQPAGPWSVLGSASFPGREGSWRIPAVPGPEWFRVVQP